MQVVGSAGGVQTRQWLLEKEWDTAVTKAARLIKAQRLTGKLWQSLMLLIHKEGLLKKSQSHLVLTSAKRTVNLAELITSRLLEKKCRKQYLCKKQVRRHGGHLQVLQLA
mmetsp:Transcript_22593/g.40674  ORF Transcript_22593/g.40674 Transcript_22593/m.40674 type:complete len:110 (-) Transcript_22593:1083-1412(-)